MRRTISICILILLVLLIVPGSSVSGDEEAQQSEPMVQPHDPIRFDGSMFNGSLPEGVIGNGTEDDPFFISGHWINTSSSIGIEIVNSSYHFLIQTCLFTSDYQLNNTAMKFINSTNIQLDHVYAYYSIRGVEIIDGSDISIRGSGFFGCLDGIYVQGTNISIDECLLKVNVESGIRVNRSSNVTITDVISDGNTAILGVTAGIQVIDSDHINITRTTCSLNYGFGIIVEPSDPSVTMTDIRISDSYIYSNNNGIVMKNIQDSSVENCQIQHNTNGVYLTNAVSFDIQDCRFYKNTYGAFMSDSVDMNIDGNILDKNENAIYLDSTNRSTITGNHFTNGTWHAITIDTWLDLGPDSSGNVVYGNEFRDNGPIGSQVMDNGVNNSWYHQNIGNTWHDHWGPDADNDTIVDEPYLIYGLANASDIYPRAIDKGELIIDDIEPTDIETDERDRTTFWIIFGFGALVILLLVAMIAILRVPDD